MEAGIATITAWSYGLAAFIYAAFALYLAAGWRSGARSRALSVAVALCALWGAAGVAFALWENAVFLAGSLLADVLRFGGWYFFLLTLLRPEPADAASPAGLPKNLRWLAGGAVALVAGGVVAQLLSALGVAVPGGAQRLALLASLAMAVFALALIEQLFRNVASDSLWSIKPLCLGLGGAFLFDLYLYSDALLFNRIDVDAFSIRGFAHALVVPLVAVSTVRSRDWKTRIVLSQRAALQSATLVMVGVYLLFMAAAGYYVRYFGGDWGRAFQLALLFAALLILGVLAVSGSMRAKLRVLVGKHFFSYRYDYREEWLRFTQALSAQDGFSEMGAHVVRGLADMVESPAGALWLKDPSGRFFAQAACWNLPLSSATEDAGGELCRFLIESGWVINLEEYRSLPRRYDRLDLPRWLVEVPNAWLVVPLATGSELIGFVVLATARTRIDVNWEVNDLLKTAGRQAGAFLGQMQASDALLEARKFDAFNRMSAFVVHDLKNIVAQLSLMLKNAERHRDNPEFQQDMLMTVEHSVERMRQLMMQLREGATPVDSPRGIDLGDVIRRVQTAKAGQGRDVEVEVGPGVEAGERVVAKGHEDRVERVIGHVVQNALDATERGGRVWVRLERHDGHARVEVGDTGCGMTTEFLRERLFKPFQTTKPAGMGIGAYESFQYVHELGGKVSVDSALDVGTRVSLLLPLFDAGGGMDSSMQLKESE
ncbi:MAG: PEP-CTERM system histidine kinase PrsK [Candidatus Accumulibacter sp.]|nr:PEP-CTERM system histidine kinase PrsK [Accumulibacter sp.]